jgi:isocitrate dehydrogenase kinase/phosphatase
LLTPAELLAAEYAAYAGRFDELTARAPTRFADRDWAGGQADAAERLALYRRHVDRVLAELPPLLGVQLAETAAWKEMREHHREWSSGRSDAELAETFFNSVTRRVFSTVGVNPAVEFTDSRVHRDEPSAPERVLHAHAGGELPELLDRILAVHAPDVPWAGRASSIALAAESVARDLAAAGWDGPPEAAHLWPAPFYRNKGAYLVGRLHRADATRPLVLALRHDGDGMSVDAALTSSEEASVVFGFSWSYFRVAAPEPWACVRFLRSLMPLKRVDELYNSIGHNKHGKTELYRELLRHLHRPASRFEPAEGEEGMVMSVITLPSLNVVFKLIKDRFGHPKRTTAGAVRERYALVFRHDRAGRLADAQEFERLAFPRACFPPELLERLLDEAGSVVSVRDDEVVIAHLYTERRVVPLDRYLLTTPEHVARAAVLDYGWAIKELAAANIFAGDMLLKNFGVSRHGRVIFYDYDELTLLTECRFREIPAARHADDELAAEPWFPVGEHDVFPEEFASFLLPPAPHRDAFAAVHGDLLDVEWWRTAQRQAASGSLADVFPYPRERRLGAIDGS